MWFSTTLFAVAIANLLSSTKTSDEIAKEIAVEGHEQVIERKIQLPKSPCNTSFDIRILVESQLDSDFHATQISTSCGCVSRLPNQWELKKQQKAELAFHLTMPKNPEKAWRYVTLSDTHTGRSLRIALEIHAVPMIALAAAIDINQAGIARISIPIAANFDQVDLLKCTCITHSDQIKATLRAETKMSGILELEIDPEICPDTQVQLPISLDFLQDNMLIERISPMIRFRYRVAVVPNPIIFERFGNNWNANAVVQSQVLHEWLILKKPPQVFLVNGSKDLDKKVQVDYSVTDSPVTMLRLQIPANTRMTIDRIRIEAGNWKVETPASINNP